MKHWTRNKTPWVDKTFKSTWDRIESVVGPDFLPVPMSARSKKVQEFGCGEWGCALPTATSGVAAKLTIDASEAQFAELYVSGLLANVDLTGVVEYYNVYEITGEVRKKQPVYILWREEAYSVGEYGEGNDNWRILLGTLMNYGLKVEGYISPGYVGWEDRILQMEAEKDYAYTLPERTDMLDRLAGARKAAFGLRMALKTIERLGEYEEFYYVAKTLYELAGAGLLIGDLHSFNMGLVDRDYATGIRVITDPGIMIFTSLDMAIPEIARI